MAVPASPAASPVSAPVSSAALPPAIRVAGLVKEFRHRTGDGPRTFRNWVESGFRSHRRGGRFRALDGIGFELRPGEMLGVIGHNGSGKSTLLRCLGGVMAPDAGRIELAAPVTGILELNSGMHPDLSGRENIVINAVLSGLLRREAEAIVEPVIAFAELAEHIDDPVRTYSAGMRLRLGFAVAVHVEPRIVLIDEVLAVGDLAFQEKCLERIRSFRAAGAAIVLISHDTEQVARYCDRALWLERGRMRGLGPAGEVTARYREEMLVRSRRLDPADRAARALPGGGRLVPGENWIGSQEASIAQVVLHDPAGRPVTGIVPGAPLWIDITVAPGAPAGLHAAASLADAEGRPVLDTNTERAASPLPDLGGGGRIRLVFDRLDLAPGDYRLTLGLWAPDWNHALDLHQNAYRLQVAGPPGPGPRYAPPCRWSAEPSAEAAS